MNRKLFFLLLVILALLVTSCGGQKGPTTSGNQNVKSGGSRAGKDMIYIGGYDYVFAVDGEKDEIVAEIPITGPARDMSFTADGSRLFINDKGREEVSVIDTAQNKVVDRIAFDRGERKGKIFGLAVSPDGKKLYIHLLRSRRLGTELKALPAKIFVIDAATKKTLASYEAGIDIYTLIVLEDGRRLAAFGRDFYLLDASNGKVLETFGLANPPQGEAYVANYFYLWNHDRENGSMAAAPTYFFNPRTGDMKLGLLTVDTITGAAKTIKFEGPPLGYFSAVLTKDHQKAYLGMNDVAIFDLNTRKMLKQAILPNGTSYGINLSSDGKKVYVSGGGPDLTVLDARTLKVLKTILLKSDTMDLRVIPVAR